MGIIKKKLIIGFCSITIFLSAIGATYGYFTFKASEYVKEHPQFSYSSVVDRVQYWGGDLRYIDQNQHIISGKTSPLSTHFNVGNRPIKVGYSSNVAKEQKEQFDHTFEYFNELFEVINPQYKFETAYSKKSACDIYIEFDDLQSMIGANVNTKTDFINPSKITSAHIRVNNNYNNDNTNLRFYLAHELMHVLMGADDVNPMQSKTFSVFNSPDVGFICKKVNGTKLATSPDQVGLPGYMTQEQKDSYVTLLPTDISTLIAIYGDTSTESKVKYLELLQSTKAECKLFFGSQPYYSADYKLPEDLGVER